MIEDRSLPRARSAPPGPTTGYCASVAPSRMRTSRRTSPPNTSPKPSTTGGWTGGCRKGKRPGKKGAGKGECAGRAIEQKFRLEVAGCRVDDPTYVAHRMIPAPPLGGIPLAAARRFRATAHDSTTRTAKTENVQASTFEIHHDLGRARHFFVALSEPILEPRIGITARDVNQSQDWDPKRRVRPAAGGLARRPSACRERTGALGVEHNVRKGASPCLPG
jgi:hypothetical protein